MSTAWYHGSREAFCRTDCLEIVNQLAGRCAQESLAAEQDQHAEWERSIQILMSTLGSGLVALQSALHAPECERVRTVILEYDFRRRGLRLDCVLLADGCVLVVEFKRSKCGAAEREQVTRYAVSLLEFHARTREAAERREVIVVPILVQTRVTRPRPPTWPGIGGRVWEQMTNSPIVCDGNSLPIALRIAIEKRTSDRCIAELEWLQSEFSPSSTIIDAAISLYGGHNVAAVHQHGAAIEQIQRVTHCVRDCIDEALRTARRVIICVSGAPGAGKTLVGLDLVLRGQHVKDSVFITGNTPLVDVLTRSLQASYRAQTRRGDGLVAGFRRDDAALISEGATFKIVKAHHFLGRRGSPHGQSDGRILIFDEAQRTYREGHRAAGTVLERDEAELILRAQSMTFPDGGLIVVALIGHNQAIGRGELGGQAWLTAAESQGWQVAIDDETLMLLPVDIVNRWRLSPARHRLQSGHLLQSLRYYRNASLERWADSVMRGETNEARQTADLMSVEGDRVWLSRQLPECKNFMRRKLASSDRYGLIASGQGRRLAAEGLFVDRKPDIAKWMLCPEGDCRSSNALEDVQNQYQIQGLEVDGAIVCWDLDLRRSNGGWSAYKLVGSKWGRDRRIDVAQNGYRVLLTRARRALVIFVPRGDESGEDDTRPAEEYDRIAEFLLDCGACRIDHAPTHR